jgi:hypothetical protein
MFMLKNLNQDYAAIHHSIIRMLVELSRDNLTKSYMPTNSVVNIVRAPRAAEDEQMAIVKKFLKDDDDQDWRFETAEDSEDEDNDSFIDCERVQDTDPTNRTKVSERDDLQRQLEIPMQNTKPAPRGLWEGSGNVLYGGFPFNVKGIQ